MAHDAAQEPGDRAQCARNVLDLLHAGLAPREIAERLARSEATVYLLGTPDAIHRLPPPVRDEVVGAFAESLQTVFLAAVPFTLVGFLVVLFLPELRLHSATDEPSEGHRARRRPVGDLARRALGERRTQESP